MERLPDGCVQRRGGGLTVSDGTVTAKGGNGDSKDGYGGDGIRSGGVVTISGNTVNAAGGYGGKVGGYGICSFDRVAISGGTVEAAGGNGSTGGGSGIYSSVIDLSGSLELTAKAGSPTGKALLQNGRELDLDTIKDKLDPGAKVTATDADGNPVECGFTDLGNGMESVTYGTVTEDPVNFSVADTLNTIVPKLVPLMLTLLLYYMFAKHSWTPTKGILLLFVLGILGAGPLGLWPSIW